MQIHFFIYTWKLLQTINKHFVKLKTRIHKTLKIIYAILRHTNLSLSFLSTGLMHNTYSLKEKMTDPNDILRCLHIPSVCIWVVIMNVALNIFILLYGYTLCMFYVCTTSLRQDLVTWDLFTYMAINTILIRPSDNEMLHNKETNTIMKRILWKSRAKVFCPSLRRASY